MSLLKAIAKINRKFVCFPLEDKEIVITIAFAIVKKKLKNKQRTDTKNRAKKIKSDNSRRSNRVRFNIAVAILKKTNLKMHCNILLFGGTNNMLVDRIDYMKNSGKIKYSQ